jgi:SAM-dependent methyltransferase
MLQQLVRRAIGWLDNPLLWQTSRFLLDLSFGLYRRRFALLRDWGVVADNPSLLDVGCGIGQYAALTDGPYLGIDLSARYVAYARRRYRGTRSFRRVDVTTLWQEQRTFDVVLLVDFLHHLADDDAAGLLRQVGGLAGRHVVSFEPVRAQTNRVGQWIIDHDRGDFIRPLEDLHDLFGRAGLPVERSEELYLGPIRTRAILAGPAAAAVRRAG